MTRVGLALLLVVAATATPAVAQTPTGPPTEPAPPARREWTYEAGLAAYLFLEDGDFAQPSFAANRGALGLEARFNDVAVRSFSGLLGWRFAADRAIDVEVVPKFGVAVGTIDAAIPALELALTVRRLEFSGEAQFVIDIRHSRNTFFYSWSELSFRTAEWLRLGMATQRTRAFTEPRDIQRGLLAGVTFGAVDATVYWFNPDSERGYVVAAIGVSFGS